MPAPYEDRLALALDPFALLLPAPETALEVVAVPYGDLSFPMGALFYERALILDLGLFDYALAFPKALFELALVSDSASPGIDAHSIWLAEMESALEIIAVGEVLLSLAVFEEVFKVALILLAFFCQMTSIAMHFPLHPLPHINIPILRFPNSSPMLFILKPLSRVILPIIPIELPYL